ncbi:sterol 24-C-methyltransferase [Irpex rosettiformis]|uniref:Sterol 24-C-methyltransferase n=1 Tax=Irpex rosettiformis TaxID=378272 RepID=A0ACB8UEF0_9APHY|nr:sterol 24-C-methyltransferase [Irpex rosettiformis]
MIFPLSQDNTTAGHRRSHSGALSHHRTDFHFCRTYPGDDFSTSLSRHEHYLCLRLRLKPGDRVLVVGCGTGDVVFELVHYADVDVVGFDQDEGKIDQARRRAEGANLEAQRNDLASYFERDSFDYVYSVEGFRSATSFDSVYQQIHTLLKPGGRTGITDWCFTPSFTPINSTDHHRLSTLLAHTARLFPRPPQDRTISAAHTSLRLAGLHLEEFDDLAGRGTGREVEWYGVLERALRDPMMAMSANAGDLDNSEEEGDVWYETFGFSREAAVVIVEAGKRKLFTPMALFIASKPLANSSPGQ